MFRCDCERDVRGDCERCIVTLDDVVGMTRVSEDRSEVGASDEG